MISEHFSRSEFPCFCGCGFDTVDVELITVLEDLRTLLDRPVIITRKGGCRCPAFNLRSGGASKSQHIQAKAADIVVAQRPPEVVADYLELKYPDKYGIGRYFNFTHVDVRSGKAARWSGHNYKN